MIDFVDTSDDWDEMQDFLDLEVCHETIEGERMLHVRSGTGSSHL